jgi:hypothetical protein
MNAIVGRKAGLALTAPVLALVASPWLVGAINPATPPADMPVAWEQARQVDAEHMADSHQNVLANEAERKERARAEAAKKRAAKERARKEQQAARARALRGGTPAQNEALGRQMCADRGWSGAQCDDLDRLWTKESGWDHRAHNSSSGAHGIPQALPGSKMASHGSNWASSPRVQIAWGLDYIANRYGNPSSAWAHSVRTGWY